MTKSEKIGEVAIEAAPWVRQLLGIAKRFNEAPQAGSPGREKIEALLRAAEECS